MKTAHLLTCITATAVLLATPLATAGRGDYETPDYQVAKSDGKFELRDYPSITVASAPMTSGKKNRNSAFMQLFGYISGKNEKQQKIKMTTPVITSSDKGRTTMSFVVPENVVKQGAPDADAPGIVIDKRSAGRFAVYRYSGRWTAAKETTARDKLMGWVKEQGLKTKGNVEKANYDPPFTLPALRRNEVMVRVAK